MGNVAERVVTGFAISRSDVQLIDCPDGEVAVFSSPSPDKDTPNEDAFVVIAPDHSDVIVAIADGAGGYANGELAARTALESLIAETTETGVPATRAEIVNGFERAHESILQNVTGAATTMVAAQIARQSVRIYHVGDSGAMLIGGRGKLKLQTISHSPTGYAVEAGLLSEAEALRHAERHIVSNLLGLDQMSVTIGTPLSMAPRDTVLLASDGLFDNMLSEEIAALCVGSSVGVACARLVAAATARMSAKGNGAPSKPDDLTVMLYRRNKR